MSLLNVGRNFLEKVLTKFTKRRINIALKDRNIFFNSLFQNAPTVDGGMFNKLKAARKVHGCYDMSYYGSIKPIFTKKI